MHSYLIVYLASAGCIFYNFNLHEFLYRDKLLILYNLGLRSTTSCQIPVPKELVHY